MVYLLRQWLILSKQQSQKSRRVTLGFTLLELLIALAMSLIISSTLLAFVNNMIQTDQQEQAKSQTEQELQAAIDFINSDLREAVHIYDLNGLARDLNLTSPASSGIRNQIPPIAEASGCQATTPQICFPILAFWKRSLRAEGLPTTTIEVPQCPVTSNPEAATLCKGDGQGLDGDDAYVYSLVIYYLITSDEAPWEGTGRIGRFILRDGVKDPITPVKANPVVTGMGNASLDQANFNYVRNCPNQDPNTVSGTPGGTASKCLFPDDGFRIFNLGVAASDLPGKMNSWEKGQEEYGASNAVVTLVDYVDGDLRPIEPTTCRQVSENARLIVPGADPNSPVDPTAAPGFYVCVDSAQQLAKVYLRGNALPRMPLNTRKRPDTVRHTTSRASYFPSVSTPIVQARGFLTLE